MGKRKLARILIIFILFSLISVKILSKAEAATIENLEAPEKTVVFTIDRKAYKVGETVFESDVALILRFR